MIAVDSILSRSLVLGESPGELYLNHDIWNTRYALRTCERNKVMRSPADKKRACIYIYLSFSGVSQRYNNVLDCVSLFQQDPMSHRIIEKRRRDRMNNCLADLSRLIPAEYLKKGRGRVEKTEIIEMAIRHMKHLQGLRQGKLLFVLSLPEMRFFLSTSVNTCWSLKKKNYLVHFFYFLNIYCMRAVSNIN